jgi:hypothetical protein
VEKIIKIRNNAYLSVKRAIYKRKFSSVGEGLTVFGRPRIHVDGRIEAGKNLALDAFSLPIEIHATKNAVITIGDDVFINKGAINWGTDQNKHRNRD